MFIDIHVHATRYPAVPRRGKPTFSAPEGLIERYDELGVERAVVLPLVSPESRHQIVTTEEVLEIAREHPDRFIPFCNVDPRMLAYSADAPLGDLLEHYKLAGCMGIGEVTANLPFNDPMVENLLCHCERAGLPMIFHVATKIGGTYGLYDEPGLRLLEGALGKFPDLTFLGHSQAFWSEIGALDSPDERGGYPKGPIAAEGRAVELMRRYRNLHGDLSAGSGYNAVSRDEEFGVRFLEEFQDRLYFGTDLCAPDTGTPLVDYLLRLKSEGRLGADAFEKIARRNAMGLLGL
jgi:predicted TIM-barrel fold metal-dependent hydrolase